MWLITEKTNNIKLDPDAFYVLTDDDVSLLEAQDYQYIPHFGLFMMINLDDGYEASANPAETLYEERIYLVSTKKSAIYNFYQSTAAWGWWPEKIEYKQSLISEAKVYSVCLKWPSVVDFPEGTNIFATKYKVILQ